MIRLIESLDPKKVAQEKDIHINILRQKSDFFAFHVQKDINASISTLKFPNDLKKLIYLYISLNRRFSDVFRGYRNVTLGEYELMSYTKTTYANVVGSVIKSSQ